MNYTYFAARSDAAAAILDRPAVSRATSDDGLLSDVIPGVQFSQEFGRFAELLAGDASRRGASSRTGCARSWTICGA